MQARKELKMGRFDGVSSGSKIKKRKTRQLTDNEIETAKNTILAGMLPGTGIKSSVRNLHKSRIWLRQNDPFYRE